jgi:hypothetical protein
MLLAKFCALPGDAVYYGLAIELLAIILSVSNGDNLRKAA